MGEREESAKIREFHVNPYYSGDAHLPVFKPETITDPVVRKALESGSASFTPDDEVPKKKVDSRSKRVTMDSLRSNSGPVLEASPIIQSAGLGIATPKAYGRRK